MLNNISQSVLKLSVIQKYRPAIKKDESRSYTNHSLSDYVSDIQRAESMDQIHSILTGVRTNIGHDHFALLVRLPQVNKEPLYYAMYEYETAWKEHYFKFEFLTVDPLVRYCFNQVTPLLWQAEDDRLLINKNERKVLNDARDFNIKNMNSLPVHGFQGELSLLRVSTFGTSIKLKDEFNSMTQLHYICNYIHEAVMRILGEQDGVTSKVRLTGREQEILSWVAQGKGTWDIGCILNISEHTVSWHIKNIFTKLNVRTRQHAVAKAISFKLITL